MITESIKIVFKNPNYANFDSSLFSSEKADEVLCFHKSFEEYFPTPLCALNCLAEKIGLGKIYVKDESYRYELNAFKVLGGSYAIGTWLKEHPETKDAVFVTATDGNHGRGIAWTAKKLGYKAVVYMPKVTAKERFDNIKALGADVTIQPLEYDDCVKLAKENAEKNGWVLVQDTAWDGYEEIPTRIMQGYMSMAKEAAMQMKFDAKFEVPTHIFMQAGVGTAAASVFGYYVNLARERGVSTPKCIVVEPHGANCYYQSALQNKRTAFEGEMITMMAGLCCGVPSTTAWEIINNVAVAYASCSDEVSAEGMRLLARPNGTDEQVISGESGAVGLGLLNRLMTDENLKNYANQLELDSNSRVLLVSTEGATDKENYARVVERYK